FSRRRKDDLRGRLTACDQLRGIRLLRLKERYLDTAEIEGSLNILAERQGSVESRGKSDRRSILDGSRHSHDAFDLLGDRLRLTARITGIEYDTSQLSPEDSEKPGQETAGQGLTAPIFPLEKQ